MREDELQLINLVLEIFPTDKLFFTSRSQFFSFVNIPRVTTVTNLAIMKNDRNFLHNLVSQVSTSIVFYSFFFISLFCSFVTISLFVTGDKEK